MRFFFRNKFNNYFALGLLAVLLTILYVRPLNSPWHPYIAGDGLGYYAYLPAKFIHNDPDLDFKWFNRVYNENYVYSSFENPEDNLLVQYGNKRIDKYYQGLSYIWMPFFFAAHVTAKIFHLRCDGFSAPYQAFMGIASVFYLFAGLLFLRLLLLKLFRNQWVALGVPLAIFFGTHLFTYAVFANTLSHLYSFTFIAGFLYYSVRFFQDPGKKSINLALLMFCFVIGICIRPLNGLIVLAVPAFIPRDFFRESHVFEKIRLQHVLVILATLGALFWQLWLTHIQTGTFFAYTYTDEKFFFLNAKFVDALFSYHMGLFVYAPVILLSMFGLFFMRRRMSILLAVVFLLIIFIYSAWWYWPVTKRAVIDFYALPAILLAGLLVSLRRKRGISIVVTILVLTVIFYQFKAFQVRAGILDEFLTYKELFWRNFFRTEKANIYPVPPKSIIESKEELADFESMPAGCVISSDKAVSGKCALMLDQKNYICKAQRYAFPKLYGKDGVKKLRIAFDMFAEDSVGTVHAFVQFTGKREQMIVQVPFYINADYIHSEKWDHKEFGYDLVDTKLLNTDSVAYVDISFWNVEAKHKLYIDDLRTSFILTDRSFETVK